MAFWPIVLKIHLQPQINPPPSKPIRHRILLCANRFDPSIACLVGHLHEVEHFEAEEGLAGKLQEVCIPSLRFFPVVEAEAEADVDPVVGIEAEGVAVNDVVALDAEGQPTAHRQVNVGAEGITIAQVILEEQTELEQLIRRPGHVVYVFPNGFASFRVSARYRGVLHTGQGFTGL